MMSTVVLPVFKKKKSGRAKSRHVKSNRANFKLKITDREGRPARRRRSVNALHDERGSRRSNERTDGLQRAT